MKTFFNPLLVIFAISITIPSCESYTDRVSKPRMFFPKRLQDSLEKYVASIDTLPLYYDGINIVVSIFLYEENDQSKMNLETMFGSGIWPDDKDSTVFDLSYWGTMGKRLVELNANPKFRRWINKKGFIIKDPDSYLGHEPRDLDWYVDMDSFPKTWHKTYILHGKDSLELIQQRFY